MGYLKTVVGFIMEQSGCWRHCLVFSYLSRGEGELYHLGGNWEILPKCQLLLVPGRPLLEKSESSGSLVNMNQ